MRSTVLWINNGTVNNAGVLSFEKANASLSNYGVVNNSKGSALTSRNELRNSGVLRNEGTLRNNGRIVSSGELLISDSGSISGSGSYHQLAGTTLVFGSLVQASISIDEDVLLGSGTIQSVVTLHGGTVAPGHSTGKINILGDYIQAEVAGLSP
ncbi:MAG: hypothetical protein GTO41_03965 [Burkholderiales bacterium]|nr:hypothetical protein [Burkholderiales bacterium]